MIIVYHRQQGIGAFEILPFNDWNYLDRFHSTWIVPGTIDPNEN